MADKVRYIYKKDHADLFSFTSDTTTKEFKKLPQGTNLDLFVDEGKDFGEQFVGPYTVKGLPDVQPPPDHTCAEGTHWDAAANKCVADIPPPPDHTCADGQHWDVALGKCVVDTPPPPEPTGDVLYDSTIHSKLHDGKKRTIKAEGSLSPNGLGVECRASGNPVINVNEDNTYSLLDNDLGRFYGYVCNFNATLIIEAAFWTGGSQTLSLKTRSRHNEGSNPENRFGGYGFALTTSTWDAKREDYHNVHTSTGSGKLPAKVSLKEYFTVEFTVKDEGSQVRQIAKFNGKEVMNTTDKSPKPYMQDAASFAKQSYYWVRQNTTSLTEIRIKRLRIIKA